MNASRGERLFEERVTGCGVLLKAMFAEPYAEPILELSKDFIVTGVGSSEAHGRFMVYLINEYTRGHAVFYPLSKFFFPVKKECKTSTLVVFSQGLSPNARLALEQRERFGHTVLFTGADGEALDKDRQTVICFPPEEESELLIRVMGPVCGYLRVMQFVEVQWPGVLPACSGGLFFSAVEGSEGRSEPPEGFIEALERGLVIIGMPPLGEYWQNIGYKFLEGLFIKMPYFVDLLSFAHGAFQELIANPCSVIVLKGDAGIEDEAFEYLEPMLGELEGPVWEIRTRLPDPWCIIDYEMVLNYFLIKGMKALKINQRDWPGKGKDDSLYTIKEPLLKFK